MKLRAALSLTLVLASPLFAQLADPQPSIVSLPLPGSRNLAPPPEPPRRSNIAGEGTAPNYVAKFNTSGGVTESEMVSDPSGVSVYAHLYLKSRHLLMMYADLAGNGNDIRGMMGMNQTFAVGFNSEGNFVGQAGQLTGRQLYFYDVQASRHRAVVDSNGTWWFGTSPINYSLKIAAPIPNTIGSAVDGAGNMGIGGEATTAYKLKVYGAARFEGPVTGTNIQAHYQDLAEWVPAAEDLEPGTVVVLDQRTDNTVKASYKPYDTMVAGVVSLQPGVILGEAAPTKEQIATTGRVRVKVDASRGAIAIGDILVTGSVAGTAMKSMPVEVAGIEMHRPGTIIGKALEPLDAGIGEILVLLSMQ